MIVGSGGSQKLSVIRNRQWSITALAEITSSTAASIVERYTYTRFGARTTHDAAGTVISATAYINNFGYTNREHDLESGLMHFRSRYFDVGTGEFASRDPLEFVDGMSLYRGYFVANFKDSLGLRIEWVHPEISTCGCSKRWEDILPDYRHGCRIYQRTDEPVPTNGCSVPPEVLVFIPSNDGGQVILVKPTRGDKPPIPVPFRDVCNLHDLCWADCHRCFDVCQTEFKRNLYKLCEETILRTPGLTEAEQAFALITCYRNADLYVDATTGVVGVKIFNDERRKRCHTCCQP